MKPIAKAWETEMESLTFNSSRKFLNVYDR